jgi:hypothetical protein
MGEKVEETMCVERSGRVLEKLNSINNQVNDLHDIIYKNGFVSSISKIEVATKLNTTLILLLIVSILGLAAYSFQCLQDIRKEAQCNHLTSMHKIR